MAHHVLHPLHDLAESGRLIVAAGGLVVRLRTQTIDLLAQRDDSPTDLWIELPSACLDDVELMSDLLPSAEGSVLAHVAPTLGPVGAISP